VFALFLCIFRVHFSEVGVLRSRLLGWLLAWLFACLLVVACNLFHRLVAVDFESGHFFVTAQRSAVHCW
jgi:hypothetical protein